MVANMHNAILQATLLSSSNPFYAPHSRHQSKWTARWPNGGHLSLSSGGLWTPMPHWSVVRWDERRRTKRGRDKGIKNCPINRLPLYITSITRSGRRSTLVYLYTKAYIAEIGLQSWSKCRAKKQRHYGRNELIC